MENLRYLHPPKKSMFSAFDLKNELLKIIQNINNPEYTDTSIIEDIKELTSYDPKQLKEANLEYTLLKPSVQTNRQELFKFLITEYKFDSKLTLTPLHLLIKYNNINLDKIESRQSFLEKFELTTKNKENLIGQDEKGQTPLHYAVIYSNLHAARILINTKGVNINIKDHKSLTPLQLASKNGNDEIALLLIENTSVTDLFNQVKGPNSILAGICKSKTEKFSLLELVIEKLQSNPKMSHRYLKTVFSELDANNQPLLHSAIENNHLNITEYLLLNENVDKFIRDGNSGNMPIHVAAKKGYLEMLKLLEKYNAVCDAQNNSIGSPVHIAAYYNNEKFMTSLLTNQADSSETLKEKLTTLNKSLMTPLFVAIKSKSQRCVERLLSLYAGDLSGLKDTKGNTVFHACAQYGNVDSFNFFLRKIANKDLNESILFAQNIREETVLHVACRLGNMEIIKMVEMKISHLSNTDQFFYHKNYQGQTCFHVACSYGFVNIVQYFLEDLKMLAFVDILDNNSNTSLHLASSNGHSSIVSALLNHISSLSVRNEDNNTALELSCRNGYFDISKILISHKSAVENDKVSNDFPLHVACNEGADEVVKLLLEKGVSIATLDNEGRNCLDIAISKGHRNVIKTLLEDENWESLFLVSNSARNDDSLELEEITTVVGDAEPSNQRQHYLLENSMKERRENPQLVGLFELKMWDMVELILDKILLKVQNHSGFGILDKTVKSMSNHPLTLIARSGQENLVKHEATLLLLRLKWRFLPRLAFYVNIIICLFFMIAISAYAILIIGSQCNSFNGLIEKVVNTSCKEYTVNCEGYRNFGPNVSVVCSTFTTDLVGGDLATCSQFVVSGLPEELECGYFEREVCSEGTIAPFELGTTSFEDFTTVSDYNVEDTTYPLEQGSGREILEGRQLNIECSELIKYRLICSEFIFECVNPEINCTQFNQLTIKRNCLIREESPLVVDFVLITAFVNLVKLFIQFLSTDNKSFLLSFQTWFEAGIYVSAAISIYSPTYEEQNVLASFTVLGAFLLFPLYLQKVQLFGVYVLALKRTVSNSLKFLPLVIILLAGFIIVFNMRVQSGVSYFDNDVSFSVIKTFTMVMGDFETDSMGLSAGQILNYFNFFLFICLMCIVLLNLLVGIAVSDIKLVLDEADIRQITLRIIFVLTIESSLAPLANRFEFVRSIMNFEQYETDSWIIVKTHGIKSKLCRLLTANEANINLADPQQRLEDKLTQLLIKDEQGTLDIEKLFKREISAIDVQLSNSNRRLEDNLSELSRNTTNSFEDLYEKLNINADKSEGDIFDLRQSTGSRFDNLHEKLNMSAERFEQAQESFKADMNELFRSEMAQLANEKKQVFNEFKTELESLKMAMFVRESALKTFLKESNEFIKEEIVQMRNQQNLKN